ncbi:MAG: sialate O-acetylesterase [Lentisphaeria bacterium]|nr:sialate O-acetylesterase [Lentisphaeria bacterium]
MNGFRLAGAWFVSALLVCGLVRAEISLPAIFGSHMVLQRGAAIPVWGWAAPGEQVAVSLGDDSRTVVADAAGAWRVDLPARGEATGLTMTVAGANTLVFEDVAVGEVWLCSGQSNMEMGIKNCLNADAEIAAADYPDIRLIDVPKTTAAQPRTNFAGTWVRCTPETVGSHGTWGGFSAAAYYFGRELHRELGVPVGLIDSSWGGSRIEPWTPPVGFRAVPALAGTARRIETADPRTEAHRTLLAETLAATEKWLAEARAGLAAETPVAPLPTLPEDLRPLDQYGDPTAMYNAMIHPLVPYAIRGAIWYQGESNHHDRMAYVDKTRAQVEGWRALWNNPAMPYYYVQIAPYQYGSENPEILATFWEAQAAIEKQIPHTGMAVIHDVGDLKDIHPKNKQEAGRRLALLALADTYGRKNLVCRGPLFLAARADGARMVVSFENAAGLTTRDGKAPDWFELGGDNGRFVPANAEIDGETVVLSHPEITAPTAVRYAWNKLAEPNLANGAGLPAAPFQHGRIDELAVMFRLAPEAKGYKMIYDVALTNITYRDNRVVYTTDRSKEFTGAFDRVGYFLHLRLSSGEERFVFASLDAFTTDLGQIGVPAFGTKAQFQQAAGNLHVQSNVPGLATGPVKQGWIEFWACNYAPQNAASVPGASADRYDFGDQMNLDTPHGHGSMQIHNVDAKQVVFAYNNWRAGAGADLGIGNSPKGHPDYTFEKNAGGYAEARLTILVRPAK